jgi:uncharacterized protein DUF1360
MISNRPMPRQNERSSDKGPLARIEAEEEERDAPLRGYAGLIVAFAVVVGGFLAFKKRSLPDRIPLSDLFILGMATQKVSRVVTKSRVASVVRVPFTTYEGPAGSGEVEERPRGTGLRRAIGELVSCPFCMGTWIACAGVAGFVSQPQLTRALGSIFAVGSIADFVQQAYCRVKEPNEPD